MVWGGVSKADREDDGQHVPKQRWSPPDPGETMASPASGFLAGVSANIFNYEFNLNLKSYVGNISEEGRGQGLPSALNL